MIPLFSFCHGNNKPEEKQKPTSFLEFEEEIFELLSQEVLPTDHSQTSSSDLIFSSRKPLRELLQRQEIINEQQNYMFVIDEEKEQDTVDWNREIETFSNNMKQLTLGEENDQENAPVLSSPYKKKASKKKKSLRNNKSKRRTPSQKILKSRQLQRSANI